MSKTSRSKQEAVQVLTNLGLTFTQAKAYLALCRLGISTTKTISTESAIARQDIYRTLAKLQELGLVEKALTAPVMFQPIPLQEAIEILMERRAEKSRRLQEETQRLLRSFNESIERTTRTDEKPQFVLVPENETIIKKGRKALDTAQTSIDVVTSWKRFQGAVFTYAEEFKGAAKRDVKIRVVVNKKPEDEDSSLEMQVFKKNPCKVRFILTPPPAAVMVFDKKEVFVVTSALTDLAESPALWSSNPSLVELAQNYFEIMWITAIEDPFWNVEEKENLKVQD